MTALYPTLEDLVIDQYQSAQLEKNNDTQTNLNQVTSRTSPYILPRYELPKLPTAPIYETGANGNAPPNYDSLCYSETNVVGNAYPTVPPYFSCEASSQEPQNKLVVYSPQQVESAPLNPIHSPAVNDQILVGNTFMVAPLTSLSSGIQKANVTHGVRQVMLIRNKKKSKYGLRLQSVNKGIFVQFVAKDSAAAAVRIRFGDQILKVNDTEVVGMDGDKVLDLMTKPKDAEHVTLTIRDRPFERTITLHKDSAGVFGFGHKENLITSIAKESSASRNGLLTNHRILEIDGRNIVGFSTKEVTTLLKEAAETATFTLIPADIYDQLTRKLGSSLMKKQDHSLPE